MVVNMLSQSLLWAAFVLIVAAQETATQSGGAVPSVLTRAAQTHIVTVGNVSLLQFEVISDMKC